MSKTKNHLVDFQGVIMTETDAAILFKWDPDIDAVWLPMSVVEINEQEGDLASITLPEFFAEEKGML